MAILALGSQVLDLFEHSANGGEQFDPARTGLDHIGLSARSNDELRAWASWLDAHDVACSPIREVENNMGALFDFVDPDGIQVELLFIDVGKLPPQSPEGIFAPASDRELPT
jgi:glyoxylase I family protein